MMIMTRTNDVEHNNSNNNDSGNNNNKTIITGKQVWYIILLPFEKYTFLQVHKLDNLTNVGLVNVNNYLDEKIQEHSSEYTSLHSTTVPGVKEKTPISLQCVET